MENARELLATGLLIDGRVIARASGGSIDHVNPATGRPQQEVVLPASRKWTLARAHRAAAALETGNVGINGGSVPAGPSAPFGGIKQSGYGREGGIDGVREFTQTKNVQLALG